MKASDVMTNPVICVTEDTGIDELSRLLIRMRISGVPVVNEKNEVTGIVTEADLLHHESAGIDAPRRRGRLAELFLSPPEHASEFIKNHGRTVAQVMTNGAVTVEPDASLVEVANAMEKHSVKRIPVVANKKLVGIVSRKDLIREVSTRDVHIPVNDNDSLLKARVDDAIAASGVRAPYLSVFVDNGQVEISGVVESDPERRALILAAESVEGVGNVSDKLRQAAELPAGYF